MRIYAVEEYNKTNELTKYWLFDNLEKAQDFVEQLRVWRSYSCTYSITTTQIIDPKDRE